MEGQTPFSSTGYDFTSSGKGKAPQTGVSHDYQQPLLDSTHPYCFTCSDYISDPFSCNETGHYVSYASAGLCNDAMVVEEVQHPWHEDSSGSFSISNAESSGQCFSPWEMTQTSFTQDSPSLSYPGFGLGQPQMSDVFASSSKQEPLASGSVLDFELYETDGDSISDDQENALQFWKSRCRKRGKFPDDSDFQAIAQFEGLDVEVVRRWFFREEPSPPCPVPESELYIDTVVDDDMRKAVAAFARRRHNRPCENPQSRKAPAHHRYKCTFGCRYSTHDWDTWRRHLKSKYPQNFWICKLCHQAQREPCIWYRKDKMADHMEKVHPSIQKPQRGQICDMSKVEHQADFPSACPFFTARGPCTFRPSSWEKYIEHCKEHFEDAIPGGTWQLPSNDRRRPGDDGDGGGTGKAPRRYPKSTLKTKSASSTSNSKGHNGNNTRSSQQDDERTRDTSSSNASAIDASSVDANSTSEAKTRSEPGADAAFIQRLLREHQATSLIKQALGRDFTDARPAHLASTYAWARKGHFSLIDIERQIITPAPKEARYIALDCSRALQDVSTSLKPYSQLFVNAIALTRDMGYRYLWVDGLCVTDNLDRENVYRNAPLTIFMVTFDERLEKIWYFTCHYKNFQNVLDWKNRNAKPLTCSHVRNLGHGAYGIVDEVRLSVDPQPMARKMYLHWKTTDEAGQDSTPVKELEIMQRLEHDNIPKFVAAYVSSTALNILMQPVADCNLRDLLSRPDHWPKQRTHLSSFFGPLVSALSYMHGLSCRHKDIKPANILVKGHRVYLADFGASSDFSSLDQSKSWGGGIMTPKYCAPEVAKHGRRGRKADMFSLGCVFLEMLTVELDIPLKDLDRYLKRLSGARSGSVLYSSHINQLMIWLNSLRTRASTWLHLTVIDTCERMLDLDPAKRPAAAEVLDTFCNGYSQLASRKVLMDLAPFKRIRDIPMDKPGDLHSIEAKPRTDVLSPLMNAPGTSIDAVDTPWAHAMLNWRRRLHSRSSESTSPFLWLTGSPGSGKSCLTHEHLDSESGFWYDLHSPRINTMEDLLLSPITRNVRRQTDGLGYRRTDQKIDDIIGTKAGTSIFEDADVRVKAAQMHTAQSAGASGLTAVLRAIFALERPKLLSNVKGLPLESRPSSERAKFEFHERPMIPASSPGTHDDHIPLSESFRKHPQVLEGVPSMDFSERMPMPAAETSYRADRRHSGNCVPRSARSEPPDRSFHTGNRAPDLGARAHAGARDSRDGTGKTKPGYEKIRFCSQQSQRDGVEHFWIDTCCIHKGDLTELQETINSMFRWYRAAEKCTTIPPAALRGAALSSFDVPERMRWAQGRNTTKPEDRWYCLLGIFEVTMSLIYGEGEEKALSRLKDEIANRYKSMLDEIDLFTAGPYPLVANRPTPEPEARSKRYYTVNPRVDRKTHEKKTPVKLRDGQERGSLLHGCDSCEPLRGRFRPSEISPSRRHECDDRTEGDDREKRSDYRGCNDETWASDLTAQFRRMLSTKRMNELGDRPVSQRRPSSHDRRATVARPSPSSSSPLQDAILRAPRQSRPPVYSALRNIPTLPTIPRDLKSMQFRNMIVSLSNTPSILEDPRLLDEALNMLLLHHDVGYERARSSGEEYFYSRSREPALFDDFERGISNLDEDKLYVAYDQLKTSRSRLRSRPRSASRSRSKPRTRSVDAMQPAKNTWRSSNSLRRASSETYHAISYTWGHDDDSSQAKGALLRPDGSSALAGQLVDARSGLFAEHDIFNQMLPSRLKLCAALSSVTCMSTTEWAFAICKIDSVYQDTPLGAAACRACQKECRSGADLQRHFLPLHEARRHPEATKTHAKGENDPHHDDGTSTSKDGSRSQVDRRALIVHGIPPDITTDACHVSHASVVECLGEDHEV